MTRNVCRTWLIAGATLAALGLSAQSVQAAAIAQPSGPPTGGYGLKPGDILEISVWREAEMSREVTVRPDGAISFPLAGDIVVANRTVQDVRTELNTRLKAFISDPAVSVAVKQAAGNNFYVVGKVNKPGEFPMRGTVDVMQALSIAGGTATFAKLNDIVVLRRGDDGTQYAVRFHYGDVESGQQLEENIVLTSGDTVVVP